MNFLALDVETANADRSSICQIGIAKFENGEVVNKWSQLINPESYFDPFNISIHGITESDVLDSPSFDVIYNELREIIEDQIVVHHMPFDRTAINRVCEEYGLEEIKVQWLDSAKISRRTWDQFAYSGYGLENVADFLNIKFRHHDALEDAIAAGLIVIEACKIKNKSLEDWYVINKLPINSNTYKIKEDGNPEGALYGENLVFTGTLSLVRVEAAKIAAEIGCNVTDSVTKKTTILVVGTQDSSKLAGYDKSSKHRKAEDLLNKGQNIRILTERDFIKMCNEENKDLNIEIPEENTIIKKNDKVKHEEFKSANDLTYAIKIEIPKIEKLQIDEQFVGGDDKVVDCSHESKRRVAICFKSKLDSYNLLYKELNINSYNSDDDIDVIDVIDNEMDNLEDSTYSLMKNKISIYEFIEDIDFAIHSIEMEIENVVVHENVDKFSSTIIAELKKAMGEISNMVKLY